MIKYLKPLRSNLAMIKDKKVLENALQGIAEAMAKLELEKIEGYKKSKKKDSEEGEEDDLVKVLEARKED